MAIQRPLVGSVSTSESFDVCIEMLANEPTPGYTYSEVKGEVGQLVGYYNQDIGAVQLYVITTGGKRYLRVA